MPSLLRVQDAICALQVHGEQGARLSLAMVTSEMLAKSLTRQALPFQSDLVFTFTQLKAANMPLGVQVRARKLLRRCSFP